MKADEKAYEAVKEFIEESELEIVSEKEEKFDNRIDVKTGIYKCNITIYNSGKIVVGGAASPLKQALEEMKKQVEAGNFNPAKMLPYDIERFPQLIEEIIPDCDHVIKEFVCEAIKALRHDLLLASAFLVGAASEKAICLLIDTYANSITDEKNREAFKSRVSKNRMISKKFDEFTASYRGCKTQPTDPSLTHDQYTILSSLFTFYRLTRNEVGHPEIVPNLDKGIIIANLAQFIHYLKVVYGLIKFFRESEIEL